MPPITRSLERSEAIFTFGHRNPNILVFVKDAQRQNYSGAKMYSAKNGPAEDDEINELIAGRNYGWPYYSGYADNNRYQYKNWLSATNAPVPRALPPSLNVNSLFRNGSNE